MEQTSHTRLTGHLSNNKRCLWQLGIKCRDLPDPAQGRRDIETDSKVKSDTNQLQYSLKTDKCPACPCAKTNSSAQFAWCCCVSFSTTQHSRCRFMNCHKVTKCCRILSNKCIEPDSTLCVVQKPTLLCSAKIDTTTPGKLGRAVGFSTRASRAGVGF